MAKATKSAIVMRHKPTGLFFSKTAGLTDNLFYAMSFADADNANYMIYESILHPKDPDNYEICTVTTTKEVQESECLPQITKSSCDAAGKGLEEDGRKQVRRV